MIYEAQQDGYLTPFYTVIETQMFPQTPPPIPVQTINITSSDERNRYFEEVFVLGKGEHKDFNITYTNSGNKILQTFGYKDTYMELFDSAGNLLASDDDSGYGLMPLYRTISRLIPHIKSGLVF